MEHSRENVKCFYKCFMPDLHAQTINIYVNVSKFERNARLCISASRSQIYRSVDVFFSPLLCVIGCSVEAYPRWTYHSYAVKTSAAHSSSEKWFWVRLKKQKRQFLYLGNFIFGFLRFSANRNLQKNVDVFDLFHSLSFSPLRRIELLYRTAVI